MIFEGDFKSVYKNLIVELMKQQQIDIRGEKCQELLNCILRIKNNDNIIITTNRKTLLEYLAGELFWYMTGDNKVDVINSFSSFWNKICNDDYTCNSAYGNLLFKTNDNIPQESVNQWKYCVDTLKSDKSSRRAFLLFQRPRFQNVISKDIPCTMYIIYHIRDNKLQQTVHMRSSDVRLGIIYDIPFFSILHINMFNILKKYYKDIAIGDLYFIGNSVHLYDRDVSYGASVFSKDIETIKIDDKFCILEEDGRVNYKKLLFMITYLLKESEEAGNECK